MTGVVSNDARVLQGVPCYSDTEEEAGVCHEPHEAPGMSGEALSCRGRALSYRRRALTKASQSWLALSLSVEISAVHIYML